MDPNRLIPNAFIQFKFFVILSYRKPMFVIMHYGSGISPVSDVRKKKYKSLEIPRIVFFGKPEFKTECTIRETK